MPTTLPDDPDDDLTSRVPTRLESAEYLLDMLHELARIADGARFPALHASIVAAHSVAVEQHGRLSAVSGLGMAADVAPSMPRTP